MSRRKPVVRVRRNPAGWVLPDYTDLADCTSNFHRQQDGRPPCTAPAVWRVVEDHGMHLTISYWCDGDLPEQHRPQDGNGWPGDEYAEPGTRGWTA